MNNSPTVYVPQETMRRTGQGLTPLYDLSPARAYGKLCVLVPAGPVSLDMAYVMGVMQEKLDVFSDADHILATGDPAVISAAVMIAAARNKGRVKLLRWDKRVSLYMALQLDLHEGAKDGKTESCRTA